MEFLSSYGLFLAKSLTVVAAILFVVIGIIAASSRHKKEHPGQIEVTLLNDEYDDHEHALNAVVLDDYEHKALQKSLKQKHKAEKKKAKSKKKKRSRKRRKQKNGFMYCTLTVM